MSLDDSVVEEKKGETFWPVHRLSAIPSRLRQGQVYGMLKSCLLNPWRRQASSPEMSDLSAAYSIKQAQRAQLIRTRENLLEGDRRLDALAQCRPVRFRAKPFTRACRGNRLCPWCHVRRLCRTRTELSDTVKPGLVLYSWRKDIPLSRFRGFRTDRGPHCWCQAELTQQLFLPTLNTLGRPVIRHLMWQLVREDLDYEHTLRQHAATADGEIVCTRELTPEKVAIAVASPAILPWYAVFSEKRLQEFITLFAWRPRARLFREQRRK